jgi:acetyl-CoA C-acetyltransferase
MTGMNISIIGGFSTRFGAFVEKDPLTGEKRDTYSFYDLINDAGRGAIADAGLEAGEIDAIWLGSCVSGALVNQEHTAPLALEVAPDDLRFKPTVRVEAACATSSIAIYNAAYAIASKRFRNILVIGAEKMNLGSTPEVTHALATCSYWPEEGALGMTFPGLFAVLGEAYMKQHNLDKGKYREMLAHISAQAYRNGIQNPLAHFGPGSLPEKRGLTTAEAILNLPDRGPGSNPMIAPPLRLHDCSLITDGAAAVVLTSTENAKQQNKVAVELSGFAHVTERMPLSIRDLSHDLTGARKAREQAFEEAGITSNDLDFVEVHDCFTVNQILCTEALGLSDAGRAGHDYLSGRFGPEDECPVNLSGGLKAKGHPVGATGASMHVLAYKQLTGAPIGVPAQNLPECAATLNIGGAGVTNCVSVLRRVS